MTHHIKVASAKDIASDPVVPVDFEAPVGWCPAGIYGSAHEAHEAGLAILAMGHAYWLLPHEESYIICVAAGKLPEARRELEVMQQLGQRHGRTGQPLPYEELKVKAWSFLAYAILLCACFALQSYLPIQLAGRVDSVAMVQGGEWWRAFTALTLHADVVHLVSNLVAGIGFVFLLARFFGAGPAWLLVLASGAAGNALNAWVQSPEVHLSIGASTAVFGALGMVTGVGLCVALLQPAERWMMPRWLLPGFGGLTLLGLLGVGDGLDGQIDVAAHISGFICGTIMGLVCAWRQPDFVKLRRSGFWFGWLSLALVALSWVFALG
ncbi:MAG: rhomboid family intramembrane serine protease [Opitutales bacterium]